MRTRPSLVAVVMTVFVSFTGSSWAEVITPNQPVPELGYRAVANFFKFPSNWSEGEASGVAVLNSNVEPI